MGYPAGARLRTYRMEEGMPRSSPELSGRGGRVPFSSRFASWVSVGTECEADETLEAAAEPNRRSKVASEVTLN